MKNKQKLFKRVKLFIVCYCLVGTALFYLQDKLLFRPTALPPNSTFHFTQPFTEANISLDAATKFNIVQFTPGKPYDSARGVVLYFHGNKENVNHYQQYASAFTRNNYEVWMPDYPGYGKSTGTFSEAVLYEEALQVYKLARTKYRPDQIVVYGKSLGSGIAAQLASIRDCRELVLETPYYSFTSLVRLVAFIYPVSLLSHYKIPTNQYLEKVTAPVTIFHGTRDWTIPYFHAKRLKASLKPTDEFITIDGGGHNNLFSYDRVQKKIDTLLSR
ncbi:alpha/beta hydrolase [Sediminibacterium roseum]|uniref:Alpha/beta hydrolase n=1 Tax=Sediminibacterium roseum TaxID=1978412 RepID=A0ABW9ZZ04_9BACT|nr:alpha/beta fold hydrolase [Sediminibacterium roseum]NCI51547.1 alpha/beta hydrolase [Sediminibacterium roseum]